MAGFRYSGGGLSVTISTDLAKVFDAAGEKMTPRLRQLVTDGADEVVAYAKDGWPVGRDRGRRPHSRDLLVAITSTTANQITATTILPGYVLVIKAPRKVKGTGSPWQELLRKPLIAMARSIGERASKQFAVLVTDMRAG